MPQRQATFDRDPVDGPIMRAVWKLGWPTALMNMITGVQGVVDHAMVGHFVGYRGNAAVGVSWQIFLVVIVFISSVFTGMSIVASRFVGANDVERVNRTVYQAFLVALFLGCIVFAPLGFWSTPWLLDMVKATAAVKAEALPYLRIMFVFSVTKLTFFMFSGALRSVGDSHTPLRLGIVLTVLNLILNAVLIPGLGPFPRLGTMGAAVGTAVASSVVSLYALWLLFSGHLSIRFHRQMSFAPDWPIIRQLFRFGLPNGIQGVAVNFSGAIMLRFVGSLEHSAEAHAAFVVCYHQLFGLVSWTSVGLLHAVSAVAGQNLGAHQPDRTRLAPVAASKIGLGLAAVVGLIFWALPGPLLALFGVTDERVLTLGYELLRYLSVCGFFVTVALAYAGALSGTGATRSNLAISALSQIAVPIGYCLAISTVRNLAPADIWCALLAGHALRCILCYTWFARGHWTRIELDLDS